MSMILIAMVMMIASMLMLVENMLLVYPFRDIVIIVKEIERIVFHCYFQRLRSFEKPLLGFLLGSTLC